MPFRAYENQHLCPLCQHVKAERQLCKHRQSKRKAHEMSIFVAHGGILCVAMDPGILRIFIFSRYWTMLLWWNVRGLLCRSRSFQELWRGSSAGATKNTDLPPERFGPAFILSVNWINMPVKCMYQILMLNILNILLKLASSGFVSAWLWFEASQHTGPPGWYQPVQCLVLESSEQAVLRTTLLLCLKQTRSKRRRDEPASRDKGWTNEQTCPEFYIYSQSLSEPVRSWAIAQQWVPKWSLCSAPFHSQFFLVSCCFTFQFSSSFLSRGPQTLR